MDCKNDRFVPPKEIRGINRYGKATLKDFGEKNELREYVIQWMQKTQELPAPLIIGNVGSGKTHFAYALLKFLKSLSTFRNVDINVTPATQLIANIKEGIGNNTVNDRVIKIKRLPILIIDDLGSERITDFTQELFYLIIDYRWIYQLPTVITSNFSLNELKERLGERIVSRIAGMCKPFILIGEDRRIK